MTEQVPDVDSVIDAVINGTLDHELFNLYQAIVTRNEERSYTMTWVVTVPHPKTPGVEIVVGEHDLTIDEWCAAEEIAGRSWVTLRPEASGKCMKAVVAAIFEKRADMTRVEALTAVGNLSGAELLDAIKPVEVARRPLSAGR